MEKIIEAKGLLSKVKKSNRWFGYDFNMNLYRGCLHGCIYCDSRSECYEVGEFEEVKIKGNALEILESELRSKRSNGIIGMGSMSDPYNPYEMKYELTRKSLSLMERFKFGVFIITKSDLVLRDIDVLKRVDKVARAIVGVTITCDKDELSKVIEPKVSSSSERFKALKTFSDNGIDAGILLMPILPFINDTEENVRGIVRLAIDSKAKFIYPFFGVTLRDKQREFYYDHLEKSFPGLKNKYIERYGKNYSCESDNAKELYSLLAKLCDEAKILHRMEDINKLFEMNKEFEQLSLF